jgi:hypothetical protein
MGIGSLSEDECNLNSEDSSEGLWITERATEDRTRDQLKNLINVVYQTYPNL